MQSRRVSLIYLTRRVRTQLQSAFIIKPNGLSHFMAHPQPPWLNCFVGTHFSLMLCFFPVFTSCSFGKGLKGRGCGWINEEDGFKCEVQLVGTMCSSICLAACENSQTIRTKLMMSSQPQDLSHNFAS